MKQHSLTIAIGALLLIVFGFLLFTFQVRQTEVAVVATFGKPTRDITRPASPLDTWRGQEYYDLS